MRENLAKNAFRARPKEIDFVRHWSAKRTLYVLVLLVVARKWAFLENRPHHGSLPALDFKNYATGYRYFFDIQEPFQTNLTQLFNNLVKLFQS